MAFKINVSHKGRTYKVETSDEGIIGMTIGQTLKGEEIDANLAGYQLKITGTSDVAGFSGREEYDGPDLKKILVGYGHGMHKKPKGFKKRNTRPGGLRLRKTFRGKEISTSVVQINMAVVKEGPKKFLELLPKKEEKVAAPAAA